VVVSLLLIALEAQKEKLKNIIAHVMVFFTFTEKALSGVITTKVNTQKKSLEKGIAYKPTGEIKMRGILTDEISEKAKELLSIDALTVRELRLFPYIQYIIINGGFIDEAKINDEETEIIETWKEKGWLNGNEKISSSKLFWDAICEIIWIGYANQ